MSDLTARIRARATELDAGGSGHWPSCYGGYPCTCASQPGALVRVVDAVLDMHEPFLDITRDETCCTNCLQYSVPQIDDVYDPWPCATVEAIAQALGTPTESEPFREHQGGGQ